MGFPWVFHGFSQGFQHQATQCRIGGHRWRCRRDQSGNAAHRVAKERLRSDDDPWVFWKFSHKIPRPNWPTTYYPHQINPLIFVSLSLSLSIHPSSHPSIHLFIYLTICLSICLSISPTYWSGLSSSQWTPRALAEPKTAEQQTAGYKQQTWE